MQVIKVCASLLTATMISLSIAANSEGIDKSDQSDDLASKRFHYQKAKSALAKQDSTGYEKHLKYLDDYPLRQYLEFAKLRAEFKLYPFEQIDQFLSNHQGTFLSSRLRANFLFFLASRQRWAEFLNYYSADIENLNLRCHYIHAKIKSGDVPALEEARQLWNVGKSQPNDCDPLFDTLAAAGQITEDLRYSRFAKAMDEGNTRFARYLAKQLSDPYLSELSQQFFEVHRNPNIVGNKTKFNGQEFNGGEAKVQLIIAHGIKRMARKTPEKALQYWETYESKYIFDNQVIKRTKMAIVKGLIKDKNSQKALSILENSPSLRQQGIIERLAREALGEQNWPLLVDSILLFNQKNKQSDRWQYWAARAQEEINAPIPGFLAPNEIYQNLAKNRSFYGFLAADKLKLDYSLVDNSSPVAPEVIEEMSKLDAMRRARELWLTGNRSEANAEWFHTTQKLSGERLLAAGQLARNWGWYNTGIQAMISGNFWNELTVRFPLAYEDEVYRIASDTQVDPKLIFAIARQESAFDVSARSSVGALGLMQVMPRTAKFTAKKRGIQQFHLGQLMNAEDNILIGSHYLQLLLKKFEGNRVLAAAAYNAGPHRVNRWLSESGKERPVDIWIETIPFKETRHYVQNVLCFSVIYGYRLGQPANFISKEEAKRYL